MLQPSALRRAVLVYGGRELARGRRMPKQHERPSGRGLQYLKGLQGPLPRDAGGPPARRNLVRLRFSHRCHTDFWRYGEMCLSSYRQPGRNSLRNSPYEKIHHHCLDRRLIFFGGICGPGCHLQWLEAVYVLFCSGTRIRFILRGCRLFEREAEEEGRFVVFLSLWRC